MSYYLEPKKVLKQTSIISKNFKLDIVLIIHILISFGSIITVENKGEMLLILFDLQTRYRYTDDKNPDMHTLHILCQRYCRIKTESYESSRS